MFCIEFLGNRRGIWSTGRKASITLERERYEVESSSILISIKALSVEEGERERGEVGWDGGEDRHAEQSERVNESKSKSE